MRTTIIGDANLDGATDFADLVRLAQNYNTAGSTSWFNADFNYDDIVDFNDLVALAQHYNQALPAGPIPGASADFNSDLAAANSATVPEPGPFSLLLVACGGIALRRARRWR
jgi:hypothetical protein